MINWLSPQINWETNTFYCKIQINPNRNDSKTNIENMTWLRNDTFSSFTKNGDEESTREAKYQYVVCTFPSKSLLLKWELNSPQASA